MISGGTNPPSPPAAPTRPVTPPTRDGSVTLAIRAKVAPLPEPSAAAMARNATVPTRVSGGVPAEIAGADDDDAEAGGEHRDRRRTGRTSQPPTGRMITATTTKPAIRLAASAGVSP